MPARRTGISRSVMRCPCGSSTRTSSPTPASATIATFVIATWGFTLLAVHHHRPMIVANVVAMVVSAGTVLTLAASDGATGAATATVLGEVALALGYAIAISRVDRAMRPQMGLVLRAVPALAIALAVGLLVPVPAAVQTVLALALYGVGLLLFRAVPDEILEHVPGVGRLMRR